MRIAIIVSDPSSGLVYHPCRLAVALARRGHEVHALKWGEKGQTPGLKKNLLDSGVVIHDQPVLSLSGVSALLSSSFRLNKLLRELSPCIVHTYGPVSAYQSRAARSCGSKIVTMIEAMGHSSNSRIKVLFGGWLLNRYVDQVLALCHTEERRLLSAGVHSENVKIVHNHLDCDHVIRCSQHAGSREDVLMGLGLPVDCKHIGCLATFQPRKRQDLLVRAFCEFAGKHPSWHLVLAGDGEEKEKCQALARSLGYESRIHFTGWLPSSQAMGLLSALDVVAHCSNAETFGYSMVEPILLGKPTVVTRIAIGVELERDGQAIVVSPDDKDELVHGLLRAIQGRHSNGSGKQYVQKMFDVKEIAKVLESVYRRILGKDGSSDVEKEERCKRSYHLKPRSAQRRSSIKRKGGVSKDQWAMQ